MAEQPVTIFTPSATPVSNPAPAMPVQRDSRVGSATSTTVQSNPDITPARQRFADDMAALDRLDPWRDTTNVVMKKDPRTGIVTAHPRTGNAQPTAAPGAAPGAADQPGQLPAQPQPDHGPASTDGTTLRVGDFELSPEDIAGLMQRKSFEDSRKATMPASADQYDLSLPSDFVLPPGTGEWKWDLDNPTSAALIGQAKEFAFAHGLDGPAFSKLLGLYASHQVAEEARFNDLKRAEIGKLGANVSARVDAVGTWLESQLGSDLAKALRTSMHTAKSVEAYERLMSKFISGGVTGNPGASRDGGSQRPGKLTDEQYGQLSFHEKTLYAQRMSQNGG